MTSTPMVVAGPRDCVRELPEGGVKRCTFRGPTIAWSIRCPGCGFIRPYLEDKHGFVEVPHQHPQGGATTRPIGARVAPHCDFCKVDIVIGDGTLSIGP